MHKKVSRFSQFLETNADVHKNELFVKKFPASDRIGNTKNNYFPSISPNVHGTINIEGPLTTIGGNGFTIQQQSFSLAERENLCEESQNKSYRDDKQSDNASGIPSESTITTLSTKNCLPSISNECAIAINFPVLFSLLIIRSNKVIQVKCGVEIISHQRRKRTIC